jgi:hypothetical protein
LVLALLVSAQLAILLMTAAILNSKFSNNGEKLVEHGATLT